MREFKIIFQRHSIRAIAIIVALSLIWFYCNTLYVFSVTFQTHPSFQILENIILKLYYIFNYGIYIGGLPPVILAIYFLILCKAPKSNLLGLLIVALSIFPIHFVVAFTMSGSPSQFVPLQFGQLLITFYLIAYWKEKGIEKNFRMESQKNKANI